MPPGKLARAGVAFADRDPQSVSNPPECGSAPGGDGKGLNGPGSRGCRSARCSRLAARKPYVTKRRTVRGRRSTAHQAASSRFSARMTSPRFHYESGGLGGERLTIDLERFPIILHSRNGVGSCGIPVR